MKRVPAILIADRNARIRRLLRRELAAEGYRVCLAQNGNEVVYWVTHNYPLDLLVIDPDLPGIESLRVSKALHRHRVPMVIHTLMPLVETDDTDRFGSLVIEKTASSTDVVKGVVKALLESETVVLP